MPYCNYCGKILTVGQTVCKQCNARLRQQSAQPAPSRQAAVRYEYSCLLWDKGANSLVWYDAKGNQDRGPIARAGFFKSPFLLCPTLNNLSADGWEVASTDFSELDGGAMYILLRRPS